LSAESELNQPQGNVDPAPREEFTPMPDPTPEQPRSKEYSAEVDGLAEAARDLERARAENRVPKAEDEPIDRGYKWLSGAKAGEPVEKHFTLTPERASDELAAQRAYEQLQLQPDPTQVAAAVDQARADYYGQQQPVQPVPDQAQQPDQQTQQQADQPADGLDPEVRAALENPRVRAAIEAEISSAEQARQQYAAAALSAARVSAAALLSAPELDGIPNDQIGIAIQMLARTNPARAQEIQGQLTRTQALWNASQQAQAQEQAIAQQRNAAWSKSQDDQYDKMTNDPPELKTKLGKEAVSMLKEYGATDDEIAAAWHSAGPFRSAIGQRVLRDAAAYRLAQREATHKIDRSVPPVQKPGVSRPHGSSDDGGIAAAQAAFNRAPSPKTAADLLIAKRNVRR
jgi:hypothetical protein